MSPFPGTTRLLPLSDGMTTLVQYSYAAITRYVLPGTNDDIKAGRKFIALDPSWVIPAGLTIPPIGMQILYPDASGGLGRTVEQTVPWRTLSASWNTPDTDWHYDFAFWLVQGGLNPSKPLPCKDPTSPTVEVPESSAVTMAVFNLNGGPKFGDTAAWNIEAWKDDYSEKLVGDFFHVTTDPSQAKDDRANAGLVDTEDAPSEVEARLTVGTNPYGGTYQFVNWEIDLVPQTGNLLELERTTSGRARALYKWAWSDREFPRGFPDPWWWIATRGGKVPPPPLPPWNQAHRKFNAASALAAMVDDLSPELRSEALDLASKQATEAMSTLKRDLALLRKKGVAAGRSPKKSGRKMR